MSRRSRSLLSLLAATTALAGWLALASPPALAAGMEADLAVTMVGDTKNLKYGDTITFTVTATNNGPDLATGVTLSLGTSDGYANFGGTCPDGSISDRCVVADLRPGASATVRFHLGTTCGLPPRLGIAVASVFPDAETIDPISTNNEVRAETKFVGKSPCGS
jgi:hypothetical protein